MATFSLVASAWKSTTMTLAFDPGEQIVRGVKGVVGAVHEDAAHQVDDRVGNAAFA